MDDGKDFRDRDEIFSKSVRAGKRTYFFDVKTTRANDYYLTITESKRKYDDDGKYFYEKHKLFLYKEDFDKFKDGLMETIDKIAELRGGAPTDNSVPEAGAQPANETPAAPAAEEPAGESDTSDTSFTDVNFEDLGNE